jgi:hypothetical protein
MNKVNIAKKIGSLRTEYHKNINNTYIWNTIVIDSLIASKNNEPILLKNDFRVASKKGKGKDIIRSKEDIVKMFENVISYEFYSVMLVYVVAQVEAFFYDFIEAYLKYDNNKLNFLIKNLMVMKENYYYNNMSKQKMEDIITLRISKMLYSSPKLQMEYLKMVSEIEIPELLYNNWIEIKATRDLVIHNHSIINNTYLRKVPPDVSRGKIGDKITVDENYFDKSIGVSKSLIGRICSLSQAKLRKKIPQVTLDVK